MPPPPKPKKKPKSTKAKAKCPLAIGDIDPYGSQQQQDGPGLNRDHLPSGAALADGLKRYHKKKKLPMPTKAQIRRVKQQALTIALPDWFHKLGRTFGAKNTSAQISSDSADLNRAAKSDIAAYRKVIKEIKAGNIAVTPAQKKQLPAIEKAINKMRKMVASNYLYTRRMREIAANKPTLSPLTS